MPATARYFFDMFVDVAAIERAVDKQESERLHLDFKQKPRDPDLQKLFGKALSGFANADGGVLVFGVAEIDGELSLDPLENAGAFESQLNGLVARMVSFPVQGVITRTIMTVDNRGFVVVLIPASDSAPHRSEKDKKYYRRVGDSFLPMEHYEVADMFGRRRRPQLTSSVRLSLEDGCVCATLVIENHGTGIAKYPSLEIERLEGFQHSSYGLDGNGNTGLPQSMPYSYGNFRGGLNDVVHSKAALEVTKVRRKFEKAPDPDSDVASLHMMIRICAEEMSPLKQSITISAEDMEDFLSGRRGVRTVFEAS